jgi:hypothetical protein
MEFKLIGFFKHCFDVIFECPFKPHLGQILSTLPIFLIKLLIEICVKYKVILYIFNYKVSKYILHCFYELVQHHLKFDYLIDCN